MILSSSDILRILGGDAIIRQEARLGIVERRPALGVDDTVYIYIEKYPTVDEFEATWKIWIQDNSGMGEYVLGAARALLPNFESSGDNYVTRDFASERTVVKSETEKQLEQLASERVEYRRDFEGLSEHVEGLLKGVRDGLDGKDGQDGLQGPPGRDGRDGVDGRDGRDLVATDAELFDLGDVEKGIQMEPGQVLTWDGTKWTNLFVRQTQTIGGGGSGGEGGGSSDVEVLDDLQDVSTSGAQNGQFLQYNSAEDEWRPVTIAPGSGIEEAPQDGNYYVRQNGQWIDLVNALDALGVGGSDPDEIIDGGDFSGPNASSDFDGGNFTTGTYEGTVDGFHLDSGNFTTGTANAQTDFNAEGGEFTP